MAYTDKPISTFSGGTFSDTSLFVTADKSGTSYNTAKHAGGEVAQAMCGSFDFDDLPTTNKHIFGAINELVSATIATPMAQTLTAGSTTVTFSSQDIRADQLIDVYTDKEGLNYNSMTQTDGSVVLTFDAQQTDTVVQILIRSLAAVVPDHPKNDYLYNVGQIAFNTGYIHNADTKVVMKAMLQATGLTGYSNCFGARNGGYQNNSFGFFSRFNDNKFCGYRTGNEKVSDGYDATSYTALPYYGMPIILTAEGNDFSWYRENDPNTVQTMTASGTVNSGVSAMGIFCGNGANSSSNFNPYDYAFMTLYWLEIYENDTLLHRYVPAYDNDQYCLYDEVDETYLYDVAHSGQYVRGVIQGG